MPLKLNVGLSKKIGLPDYGSLGASVNLELELDSNAIGDPERLRQQIRHLFGQAKLSIEEELSRQQPGPQNGSGRNPHTNGNGNGHCQTTVLRARGGNGHHSRLPVNSRTATNGQVRAIRAITDRQGLDLGQLLGSRFRLQRPEELSLADASDLIDELKTHSTVNEDRR
ncbi:MAG: hypothetical protein V4719_06425 [Planctomycetota bacterium]